MSEMHRLMRNNRVAAENTLKELILNGRRGGDRTHNPRLRRPVLYPIELLARCGCLFHCNRYGGLERRLKNGLCGGLTCA